MSIYPIRNKEKRSGATKLVEYSVWNSMRARCLDPKSIKYPYYGGRGIRYSDDWNLFSNFIRDMGMRPGSRYQLDRIDNNGNYCKENCRWVLPSVNYAKRPGMFISLGCTKTKSNTFVSRIRIDSIMYNIGTFNTKKEAQSSFCEIYKEWHGFYPDNYKEILNEI